MPRKKEIEVKFCVVAGNEVFEPTDWPGHFFVPQRKHDNSAALRVKKIKGVWWPFDERALQAEHSFFPPGESVQIVGNY